MYIYSKFAPSQRQKNKPKHSSYNIMYNMWLLITFTQWFPLIMVMEWLRCVRIASLQLITLPAIYLRHIYITYSLQSHCMFSCPGLSNWQSLEGMSNHHALYLLYLFDLTKITHIFIYEGQTNVNWLKFKIFCIIIFIVCIILTNLLFWTLLLEWDLQTHDNVYWGARSLSLLVGILL